MKKNQISKIKNLPLYFAIGLFFLLLLIGKLKEGIKIGKVKSKGTPTTTLKPLCGGLATMRAKGYGSEYICPDGCKFEWRKIDGLPVCVQK